MILIGTDPSRLFPYIPRSDYLLIAGSDYISHVRHRAKKFDPTKHCFNPLSGMTYHKARQMRDLFSATFPESESTLTKSGGLRHILKTLVRDKPATLDDLAPAPSKTDTGLQWAHEKVEELLLSPILSRVLESNLYVFKGTIHAVLDRESLGDFDCRLLGRLLIMHYPGTVVVPDFGFYALPAHVSLIRERRLIASIRELAEVPELSTDVLFSEEVLPARCTADDAETLATYRSGHRKGTEGYSMYVENAIA